MNLEQKYGQRMSNNIADVLLHEELLINTE